MLQSKGNSTCSNANMPWSESHCLLLGEATTYKNQHCIHWYATAFAALPMPWKFFSWTWSWIFFSWAFHVLGKISLGHVILLCPFLFIHKLYSLQGFFFPWGCSLESLLQPGTMMKTTVFYRWLVTQMMKTSCGLLWSNIDFLAFRLY